jgi:hypothetical protein
MPEAHQLAENIYPDLRAKALAVSPADIGITPSGDPTDVWGGMFEVGVEKGTATFLCLADGTTSMYTSTGGGVIGGHAHESIRVANRAFLAALRSALPSLPRTTTYPLPPRGHNAFIAFTFAGKHRAEAEESAILKAGVLSDAHPLTQLYVAGHDVVAAFRLTQASPINDPWEDLHELTFDGVRDRALRLTPERLGFTPTERDPRVWGAIIDVGIAGGRNLTFVSFVDGSCAYQVKGGGGVIIKGTARQAVAKENHEVLRAVDAALGALRPATAVPMLLEHRLSVTALTYSGRMRLEDAFDAAGKPPPALAEPYTKAVRLMQTLKALAAKQPPKA